MRTALRISAALHFSRGSINETPAQVNPDSWQNQATTSSRKSAAGQTRKVSQKVRVILYPIIKLSKAGNVGCGAPGFETKEWSFSIKWVSKSGSCL
jgi:hypothetical protein